LSENYEFNPGYSEAKIQLFRQRASTLEQFKDDYASVNGDLFADESSNAIQNLSNIRPDNDLDDSGDEDYVISVKDNNMDGQIPNYVASFVGRDFNLTYVNWGENVPLEFPGIKEIDRTVNPDELEEIYGSRQPSDPEAEKEIGDLPSDDFDF